MKLIFVGSNFGSDSCDACERRLLTCDNFKRSLDFEGNKDEWTMNFTETAFDKEVTALILAFLKSFFKDELEPYSLRALVTIDHHRTCAKIGDWLGCHELIDCVLTDVCNRYHPIGKLFTEEQAMKKHYQEVELISEFLDQFENELEYYPTMFGAHAKSDLHTICTQWRHSVLLTFSGGSVGCWGDSHIALCDKLFWNLMKDGVDYQQEFKTLLSRICETHFYYCPSKDLFDGASQDELIAWKKFILPVITLGERGLEEGDYYVFNTQGIPMGFLRYGPNDDDIVHARRYHGSHVFVISHYRFGYRPYEDQEFVKIFKESFAHILV